MVAVSGKSRNLALIAQTRFRLLPTRQVNRDALLRVIAMDDELHVEVFPADIIVQN